MTTFSKTALYALTVQPPTVTQDVVVGDFFGNGKQQILTASGSRLTLSLVLSRKQTDIQQVFSQDMFAIVRHVNKFHLAGSTKDLIAISTDSGRLMTYEYNPVERRLEKVHTETYGKSGIRRVVPGEHFAVDPKGRAIMLASLEKNKLVYILTRSGQKAIAISSPLEAHKAQTLVYCLLGLDVGYDNPIFAAIELDFSSNSEQDTTSDSLEKELVYYELDLGLNHIVRKWSEPIDRTANILFSVPGGTHGPSGVLCCGEDNITYRRMFNKASGVHRVAIPRREGTYEDPNRKRIIVAGASHKTKGGDHFFLLQTDDGDLFKVSLLVKVDPKYGSNVQRLSIKYYDTIPVASKICILKSGFVYVACESGDRQLYDLESLGEGEGLDDESGEPEFDSTQFPIDASKSYHIPFFQPRPLKHLNLVETVTSMNPIMGMEVANPAEEDAPQIYTISGTGSRSTFRTTRNALDVLDLIESELPGQGMGVWTTKSHFDDPYDVLIVLSMISATLILKIGENVEQATNTGFIADTTTLGVQQFGSDCMIQIHPRGIRHIQGLRWVDDGLDGETTSTVDWHAPPHRTVIAYAANNRQVAIALSSGDVLYFECDADGSLGKAEEQLHLEHTVTCLAIPDVPEGRVRSNWLAVGTSDLSIRIYNLEPNRDGRILDNISLQQVTSQPSALAISTMRDTSPRGYSHYLHIGLRSGVYIRSVLEDNTGDIGATRRRFLGPSPVKFARVDVGGENAMILMASRPWLSYPHPRTGAFLTTPVNYMPFDSAWNFNGENIKGVICVNGGSLRIFALKNLTNATVSTSIPLRYTPRKLVAFPEKRLYYVIESDNNTLDTITKQKLAEEADDQKMEIDSNAESEDEGEAPPETDFGHPKSNGMWASCIQVIDPVDKKAVIHTLELGPKQSVISAALVPFESKDGEYFLAVGVATGLSFAPKLGFEKASIHIYKVTEDGAGLEFYHETDVAEPPLALLSFKGKLLAGVGKNLSLYDCGMKALLRKAQAPHCVSTRITGLKTQGSRIIVSDLSQSVTYVVHKDLIHPNRLIPFADDTIPRWTTATEMVDYDTVAGGDKFGNLWIVRCPQKVSEASEESADGQHLLQDRSYLSGTPNRVELVMSYFANDIPVAIQKTNLLLGGDKIVFWAGLQGTLGAMIPIESRTSFKMLQQLEHALRNEDEGTAIAGRNHLAFRGYYTPPKGVIDGDLIETFLAMPRSEQDGYVSRLDVGWSTERIEDTIWNLRALYVF